MKHFIKKTVLMLLGTMMAVVASAQDFSKREASLSRLVSLSVTRSDGGDNQTAFPVASDEPQIRNYAPNMIQKRK